MMEVDSNKNLPLYLQIKHLLVKRIRNKEWKPNELIPTERELMTRYQVSRTTIRQAVELLVQEGILEKIQGKGTVVKLPRLVGNQQGLRGFAEQVKDKGFATNSKVLRVIWADDLFREQKILKLSEQESKLLLIERIRYIETKPVAFERSCWPGSIGELFIKEDLSTLNFYEVLERNGIFLKRSKDEISAVNATTYEATLLGIQGGQSLLHIKRLSFGIDNLPIEWTHIKFRSDFYEYQIKLTR